MSNPVLTWAVKQAKTTLPGPITYDDVIRRGLIALAVLVASAVAGWTYVGYELAKNPESVTALWMTMMTVSLPALVWLVAAVALRQVGPICALGVTALEGLALGLLAGLTSAHLGLDVIATALLATVAGFTGTYVAHTSYRVRVSARARRIGWSFMWALLALGAISLACTLAGHPLGLFGPLSSLMALLGIGLAVWCLLMDFDAIDDAVAGGVPASRAWGLVLGLVLSRTWLFEDLLRVAAALDDDNPRGWLSW